MKKIKIRVIPSQCSHWRGNPQNRRRRLPHQPAGWFAMTVVIILLLSCSLPVSASDGKVSYSGNAGNIVFEPSSEHSLTDLFPNFKGVMPGDALTQKITVKNNANNKVKVNIYIRSLGAHEDSVEFLSQLSLKVKKCDDNEIEYMFDAAVNETAGLTDWVLLGTLYSGGEVNLDVILNVPTGLDNEFQNKIGHITWEFMVEELPIEPGDPDAPQTGDRSHLHLWFALMIASLGMITILLLRSKARK